MHKKQCIKGPCHAMQFIWQHRICQLHADDDEFCFVIFYVIIVAQTIALHFIIPNILYGITFNWIFWHKSGCILGKCVSHSESVGKMAHKQKHGARSLYATPTCSRTPFMTLSIYLLTGSINFRETISIYLAVFIVNHYVNSNLIKLYNIPPSPQNHHNHVCTHVDNLCPTIKRPSDHVALHSPSVRFALLFLHLTINKHELHLGFIGFSFAFFFGM